jgi:4-carboxymuconolactone decarboxylase
MIDSAGDNRRRFGPLPVAAMNDDQREIAAKILAGPRGSSNGLRGPFEALLHSPSLADRVQEVGEYVRFRSSLPRALTEMGILMTARRWTAQFEWYAHRLLALDAGLNPKIVEGIAQSVRPVLDDDESAIYDFVAQLLDRGDISDEAWEAVFVRWGKRGAIELIVSVGYYSLISFVLNVDRYPVPDTSPPLKAL